MKIAFSILSHKYPDSLFIELLEYLSKFKNATIVVHHDDSQSQFDESLIDQYNLHMIRPSFATRWGHISKIPAIIATFEKAYEVAPDLDWLITLSTNCFPIKSHRHIETFFAESVYDYYMSSHPLGMRYEGIFKWHYRTLFTKYLFSVPFVSRKGKFYKKSIRIPINPKKTGFKGYQPYTGADWFFINNRTLRRVIGAKIVDHPISKHVARQNLAPDMNASPDEIILQSFIRNQSDLNGCDNYYRYINWEGCQNWHPNTLTKAYWNDIKESDALFARKFDLHDSKELIEKIKREIFTDQLIS